MSTFWASLLEGGVTGLAKGAGAFVKDVRTAITGKEPVTAEQQYAILAAAQALEASAMNIETQAAAGQIELNKIDAQSGSLFKGGWRPAVGWVCVFALGYQFLLRPILPWVVEVVCLLKAYPLVLPPMPGLDVKEIMSLLLALLGMGGFRMYEKAKGVASK